MNKSEEITYELCKKSFLSLWSFANPLRGDGKELCDVLVVVDPNVVIFSVKEIQYTENANQAVALERWERRAIKKSAKQIYNAQRWIVQNRVVLTKDKETIAIPDLKKARIHRVAVALGSKGMVPIGCGDFGKGFVHVHDETSFHLVLQELDTITDFVDYLSSVESFLFRGADVTVAGGEEDLLALYLQNNRSFPGKFDHMVVVGGMWKEFERRPEVKRRRQEDKISYLWDAIIEEFSQYEREGTLEYDSNPGQIELVLRTMAKENRFSRRILSQQIDDLLRTTPKTKRRSKVLQAQSGITYVLLVSEKERERKNRRRNWNIALGSRRSFFPHRL